MCPTNPTSPLPRPGRPKPAVLTKETPARLELVSDPPEQPHQNSPAPETEPVLPGRRHLDTDSTEYRCLVLLRKEVIQPHLPVRLPCYDFVPIASPTFDRSPHKWLGHGLRVLPTFVT